jgi:hypothetical protein
LTRKRRSQTCWHTRKLQVDRFAFVLLVSKSHSITAHENLYDILEQYVVPAHIKQLIQRIYSQATSAVHIDVFKSEPIHIQSSIRQGCPMSMLLYGLCLDPLLCMLNDTLQGIQLGRRIVIPAVTAHADDVTVFLTSPSNV